MRFFDRHPRFLETSQVGVWPDRLELRYQAIIGANRAIFAGASVLDLASHDGRWSFAALQAGARHVTGVEVREHLNEAARANMAAYGIPADAYAFIRGDLNHKTKAPVTCDVAMCLGYFYHTLNHLALIEYLASTGARYLILDGMVEPGDADVIRVYAEESEHDANGLTGAGVHNGRVIVGHPTVSVLTLMLRHFGYQSTVFDWAALLSSSGVSADPTKGHGPDNPVGDYAAKSRATLLGKRLG